MMGISRVWSRFLIGNTCVEKGIVIKYIVLWRFQIRVRKIKIQNGVLGFYKNEYKRELLMV